VQTPEYVFELRFSSLFFDVTEKLRYGRHVALCNMKLVYRFQFECAYGDGDLC
jgi:hypothetical protein